MKWLSLSHQSALRKGRRSPDQQLIASLKIAIMLGSLKPGERLPSTREVASRLQIGRNVVWRAYSTLAESGAISIESRRRAVVNSLPHLQKTTDLVQLFDWLADDVLERTRAMRVNSHSFLRYLTHRMQDRDASIKEIAFVECNAVQAKLWAAEVSKVFDLVVPGLEIQYLRSLSEKERFQFQTVLTPLYHYEEVRELFGNPNSRVVALRLRWDRARIREWRSLRKGTRMTFILERSECVGYGEPFAKELSTKCPNLQIRVIPFQSPSQVKRLIQTGNYNLVFLSGAVLNAVDDETRHSPKVVRGALHIESTSLEDARIQAGIVL